MNVKPLGMVFFPVIMVILTFQAENLWADQLPGIKEFQDSTPAIAQEVNDNNRVLSDKAQDLEARILQLENVSERLVREEDADRNGRAGEPIPKSGVGGMVQLVGGKRILSGIDCNADPHALSKAYQQNIRFKYVGFYIIGNCYGHFALTDSENVSANSPWDELQEHGQVVSIGSDYGEPGGVSAKPKLIPHPVTGTMSLVGSFGGGLYIENVDIEVGADSGAGVLFSRGTTGDLGRSTVTCTAAGNSVRGIMVQNGAAPYLYGVTIKDCDTGIFSLNNTATTVYGNVSITSARIGIYLTQNASLNTRIGMNPTFNIDASAKAVWMSAGSQMTIGTALSDLSDGYGPGVWSGDIAVIENSSLDVVVPVRWVGAEMLVESSHITMSPVTEAGAITDADSYLNAQQVNPDCRGFPIVNIMNLVDPNRDSLTPDGDCHGSDINAIR